ncbi:MAG: DrmB family protein [Geminicoccaceae bacterium]
MSIHWTSSTVFGLHQDSDRPRDRSDWLEIYREGNPALDNALQGYDNEAVFAKLQQIQTRDSVQTSQSNPRLREFQVFGSGQPEIGENIKDSDLYAETLAPQVWESPLSPAAGIVNSVVAVHRLREVMAIYGFTRLEPAPSVSEGDMEEIQLAVKGAPLGERHNWLPAIKQYGEGIFIRFNEDVIDNWQGQDAPCERGETLYRGYKEHLRRSPSLTEDSFKFPGLSYILLHSLAHALITEIALECGYPVSSLKERIYAFRSEQEPSKYGVLIYAVTLGADGTLGGLVQVAGRLPMILERALERHAICSNDPVCADHDPATNVDDCTLLGAACHGCLLLPETSCERRNSFLDRSLLVDTMASQGSSLFTGNQR